MAPDETERSGRTALKTGRAPTALRYIVICAAVAALGTTPRADQSVDVTPTVVQPPLSGRETFGFYCASCHGRDGSGGGPAAAALKVMPANLTTLAATNGGVFPRERVHASITHGVSTSPAHGSATMPVWGPIFQALDPSDKTAAARIDNLVTYIGSLQRR
jgi:mono/diheme cytochrome c family protein